MINNLPLFRAYLSDEESGILNISLVDEPATNVKLLCFEKEKFQFSIEDDKQHIIKTVLMVADTPMYRCHNGNPFYLYYDKQTLTQMCQKMLRDTTYQNFDMYHNGQLLPKGTLELIEVYQKDIESGINPTYFDDIPDGSILVTYKVNDPTIWEMCENGTLQGISLTGLFTLSLEEQFSKIKQNFNMTLNNLKNLIKDILLNFNSQESNIGNIFYNGEEIQVGTALTDKEGNPIADGLVKIDGYDLVVKDGMVESMTPTAKEEEETPSTEDKPTVEEPITEEVKEEDEQKVDETPIEEQPTEETPTEETPTEETPEDVTPVVDEPQSNADIEGLKAEVDALKSAIAELLTKINTPAESPIIEEFSAVSEKDKNLPKNIQKLMRYGSYLNK